MSIKRKMGSINYSISIIQDEVIRNNEVDPTVLILKDFQSLLNEKYIHPSVRRRER